MVLRTKGAVVIVCLMASTAFGQADDSPPARVVVAAVVEQSVVASHDYVGTVAPLQRSIVGSGAAGRVVAFSAEEGHRVSAAEPLAQLRTGTLEIQLKAAQAELRLRTAELSELENGALVQEVKQAVARMKAAEIATQNARRRLDRVLRLIEQNAVSSDDLDTARAQFEQAEQLLIEAQAQHELVVSGPRPERIAQATARQEAQLEQVRVIEDQISKHTIVAPFDGYVIREHTEVGQWVDQGGAIAEIVHLDHVEVRVLMMPAQVVDLDRDSHVPITVAGIADTFDGEITGIVPQAHDTSRSVPVMVRVKNRDSPGGPVLKAGMLVRGTLKVHERKGVLLVPKDALVLREGATSVFVVDGRLAREVAVRTHVAEDNLIEISGPLKAGDLVVVEGNERLKNGQPIDVTPRNPATESD